MIWWSTPEVFLSSTRRMALCTPAVFALALTFSLTGVSSGSETYRGLLSSKVPSLFFHVSLCWTSRSGPVVRVTTTS